MGAYNLEHDEFVLLQDEYVTLFDVDGEQELDELVLTNQNLIFVASKHAGLLTKKRYVKRCPLYSIVTTNGIPQIVVSNVKTAERGPQYRLQIQFEEGAISLSFEDNQKRIVDNWATSINKAIVGDLSGIQDVAAAPKEVNDLMEGAKNVAAFVVGAQSELSRTIRSISEASQQIAGKTTGQAQTSAPVRKTSTTTKISTTTKCSGCHAPLSGYKGAVVACPYCGTQQTL